MEIEMEMSSLLPHKIDFFSAENLITEMKTL